MLDEIFEGLYNERDQLINDIFNAENDPHNLTDEIELLEMKRRLAEVEISIQAWREGT